MSSTGALLGPVLKQGSVSVLLEGRGWAGQSYPWGLQHIGLQDPGRSSGALSRREIILVHFHSSVLRTRGMR